MNNSLLVRRWPLLLFLFIAVVGIGIGLYVWFNRQTSNQLPSPDSKIYHDYVRAFQVAEAALQSLQPELALKKLNEAIELIPEEPAAWANRGLYHLRTNNFKEAARDLQEAKKLAPESSEIEALLGLLYESLGLMSEAAKHFRASLEYGSKSAPDLYKLAEMIDREAEEGSDAEYQRLMEQILAIYPNNLPVLVKRAKVAFQRKDMAAFQDSLNRLAPLAKNWPPRVQDVFARLQKAAKQAPDEVTALLLQLEPALMAVPGIRQDFQAINPGRGQVGTPLHQFLRLEPLRPTSAPADVELRFTVEPLKVEANDKSRWEVLTPLWCITAEQRKMLLHPKADKKQADPVSMTMLLADAQKVWRGPNAAALPFPSGPKQIKPSSAGLLAFDLDNDFCQDLLLAGAGGLRLSKQQPDGSLVEITAKINLPQATLDGDYYGAWPLDTDIEGDLDVLLARRSGPPLLLRNNRDQTFKAEEIFSSVNALRDFVWADLDNDGASDAILLDSAGKLHIFANERAGQFRPWPLPKDAGNLLGITAADINDDGVFDLIAVRSDGSVVRFSDQEKRKSWQVAEIARWPGDTKLAPGIVKIFTEDLDNNGAPDLIVAGQREAHIYIADGNDGFISLDGAVPLQVFAVMDLNRDGRLDLLGLSSDGQPVQALNQGQKNYNWLVLWPLANPNSGDNRINSFAIGGEVEIRSGLLVQKQRIQKPPIHFGLGDQKSVAVARIVWPNESVQWEFDLVADQIIAAEQRLTGSCPFLFTHNGKDIQFAGDFMWATPLGMYVNGQNTGPTLQTTEWLKIDGSQLAPHNGQYDVRVHANLWETDYFDQLALIVVDHPPGTEMYVDESFFLKPTPPYFRLTTPAKPVARAWDQHGNDASEEVRKIDARYFDHAARGMFQGITQDHWIEVDLGEDVPTTRPVWLIARGWLQPTNSSINVAIEQGKHEVPRPLVLEVPDGKGGWKVGQPALGFPAGKNKTMLIRLDGIEGEDVVSRRFRLRTTMEIYWDYLGYAQGLSTELARVQRPAMLASELRYRGILKMTQKNRSSPELPDYNTVLRGVQYWRDLTGYYTRFGDVSELLEKVDDRYVIMNAGDEIALRFAVPDAPPQGWVRDFIWECDGWTRDGNPNTRFGRTVLPLPYHQLQGPEMPPNGLENDPVYQRFPDDWKTYHTRYVTPEDFERGLRWFQRPRTGDR